jgi:UDP-glucuronate decarboxylase
MKQYSIRQRVLVTGGAGFLGSHFLGSHLCDRLIKDGHDVLYVDTFFTGTRANITHLLGHPPFELLRHDITFALYVQVDAICYLACPASPVHHQFDLVQTTKTNVIGAINILGLPKRTKSRILQASTSEVYGVSTSRKPVLDQEIADRRHRSSDSRWGARRTPP